MRGIWNYKRGSKLSINVSVNPVGFIGFGRETSSFKKGVLHHFQGALGPCKTLQFCCTSLWTLVRAGLISHWLNILFTVRTPGLSGSKLQI